MSHAEYARWNLAITANIGAKHHLVRVFDHAHTAGFTLLTVPANTVLDVDGGAK